MSAVYDHQENSAQNEEAMKLMEALIASETRYRRLFESAKDGILILDAKTGKIVDVNPFLINLLGYSKEEFVEKSIWEIGAFQDIIENKEKFLELQQNEYVRYDDLPLVTSHGLEIHVEFVSNVYLCNSLKVIQCNIRDITERTNTRNEIKFQANLINNVGQAVIATDLLGKVIYWNKAAEQIYGWSSSEAIGKNIVDLTPAQQSNEQADELMQKLSTGKTWAGEFQVKRKDGSSFPAFVTDTPMIDAQGKLTGIIGISSDITARKIAEKELIKAKNRAEESDRLKSAFLANMSHEIRTPMNGILGFTELLQTADLSGNDREKYISIIEKSGARLLNLINDIISISKIESNEIDIALSEIDIKTQIEDISNFFRLEAEKKNLTILVRSDLSAKESILKTDNLKLYAVLSNLVKNAIKFTTAGSVELGYTKKEGSFEFCVKDTGIGIPEAHKKLVFERFRQGSESLTRNYEGAGLGLSISKAYVEMLGGKIWVENNAHQNGNTNGVTFFFTIPCLPLTEKANKNQAVELEKATKTKFRKLNILIVEDDKTSELLITKMVQRFTEKISVVTTGFEAIDFCRKNSGIDLVLMDINLPQLNGYETTRRIRAFNTDLIIIAQTAYALTGDKEKSIAAGCNDYISKPIRRTDLEKLIDKHF